MPFIQVCVPLHAVGYQEKQIAKGWDLNTPMFQAVGLEGYNIQDLKPQGAGVTGGGVLYFYVLDQDRKTKFNFGWLTIDDDDMDQDGWYNMKTSAFADYTIMPGDSIMMYAPTTVKFVYSGEVKAATSDSVMSQKGWYLVGNPSPVEVDIQKLIPNGKSVTGGGVTFFYVLDQDRKTKFNFGWLTIDDDDMDEDGWYNMKTSALANYKIQPGEAVMFYAATPLTITWPNPLPTDK